MFDSNAIRMLYDNVLVTDMQDFNVRTEEVITGIESMAEIYKPGTVDLAWDRPVICDFNCVAHRCAYLHKYAALHTVMVRDFLFEAISKDFYFFRRWVFSEPIFKICSLGGGPGSDVIGILAAIQENFSYVRASVDIVDFFDGWKYSFYSILKELGSGYYEPFGRNTCKYLDYNYVQANLLKPLTTEVLNSLSQASLVSMIKFASAAACQDTEAMFRKIFGSMKPGAMVLYIDNDGGGFHQIFEDSALRYNFISIFGPFKHQNYENEVMKVKKFGFTSCFKSTVTVHILQKCHMPSSSPYVGNSNRRVLLESPSFLVSPPTPLLFRPHCDLQQNENFRSPLTSVSTPGSGGHGKRHRRKRNKPQGCFPFKRFRENLKIKVYNIKSRASKALKKNHPIFEM